MSDSKLEIGMIVKIDTYSFEGQKNEGKTFFVESKPRYLCGTEVVRLNNIDGTLFSVGYDASTLVVIGNE